MELKDQRIRFSNEPDLVVLILNGIESSAISGDIAKKSPRVNPQWNWKFPTGSHLKCSHSPVLILNGIESL